MQNDINIIGTKELRNFGLIMAAMFSMVFGLLLPWLWNYSIPVWPWIVATVFMIPGLFFPTALSPVFQLWMKFAHILGWINTRILLSVMFYLIIMPTGLLMRILRGDPLARRLDAGMNSYRVKSKVPTRENMERPF